MAAKPAGVSQPRVLSTTAAARISQTGDWTARSGGFSGIYSTAPAGTDSSETWTTAIGSSDRGWGGLTEVSATWTASAGNASNATYEIYDGNAKTGRLLGIMTVDQRNSPVGTSDGGTNFQELGDYDCRSGTLTVVLTADFANGTVVADAIGISPGFASGGGQSRYESEPSYQLPFQITGHRTIPDVSFNGSIDSGVTTFQDGNLRYDNAGTSLSSPCWAGLIAIANQGRVAYGGETFNSSANPMEIFQRRTAYPPAISSDHFRLQRNPCRGRLRRSNRAWKSHRQSAHSGPRQLWHVHCR